MPGYRRDSSPPPAPAGPAEAGAGPTGAGQARSGPPRPAAPKPPAPKPLPRSFTPRTLLKHEVEQAAKELVVDDFVDTYFRERPKTLPELRLDEPPIARAATPPAPPAEPRSPVDEESGIRSVAAAARDEAIEVSIAEHEADLVALEAQLADREDHIESMQGEVLRLQMELEGLRQGRSAPSPSPGDGELGDPPRPAPEARAPIAVPPPAPPSSRAATRAAGSRFRGWIVAGTAAAVVSAAVVTLLAWLPPRGGAPPSTSSERAVATRAGPDARPLEGRSTASMDAAAPASEAVTPSAAPATSPSTPSSPAPPGPDAAVSATVLAPSEPLLSFQAHLTVKSNIDAEVVVQGQPVGRTNERVLVRCGPRNVRIRDERGWRSAGEHVQLTCMKATAVTIDAAP